MGIIWSKIFPPKEDNSAAVKKQAEGASNPMYALASLVSTTFSYTLKSFEIDLHRISIIYRPGRGSCTRCARRP